MTETHILIHNYLATSQFDIFHFATNMDHATEFAVLKEQTRQLQSSMRDKLFAMLDAKADFLLGKLQCELKTFHGHVNVHEMNKHEWDLVGDLVKEAESLGCPADGNCVLSFRLDLSNFSTKTKLLRGKGVLGKTYDEGLAQCMKDLTEWFMRYTNAAFAQCHSDELFVLVPATTVTYGVHAPHLYNGRTVKLCSLFSAEFSTRCTDLLHKFAKERGFPLATFAENGKDAQMFSADCRMGQWPSLKTALVMLGAWRSQDCQVNGLSDAVYQRGAKSLVRQCSSAKAKWLFEQGVLPLPESQMYGVSFRTTLKMFQGVNPKTGELAPPKAKPVVESTSTSFFELVQTGYFESAGLPPFTPVPNCTDYSDGDTVQFDPRPE